MYRALTKYQVAKVSENTAVKCGLIPTRFTLNTLKLAFTSFLIDIQHYNEYHQLVWSSNLSRGSRSRIRWCWTRRRHSLSSCRTWGSSAK